MYESQLGFIPAARNPAVHATLVTVDTIPHYLADKSADLLEACSAVKLRHAE